MSTVSRKDIFQDIKKLKEVQKWQFLYLGANQDAFKEGNSLGASAAHGFKACGSGVESAMRQASATACSYISSSVRRQPSSNTKS